MPNTLGRYHILREIARSNDIVYEAIDPATGRRIALKELLLPANLAGAGRQERIQRFTREARAAARLRHPGIVRIHDHGQANGRYYIAMEFLQGQSLRDLLRQRGALPLSEALRIARSVAEALDYAHRQGVVHRDIKPDNIHIEPDGRVVITDFGIARLTFEPTLTADGQIFGTPSYMSPEQVTGKGLDQRSDLFSLGVMLYEMVAGRKPFVGDTVITITYNIMNAEPPPLPGAPPGLDAIVRRAMAKDPEQRYRSAGEMAEDLALLQQGQPPRHATALPPVGMPAPVRPPAGGASPPLSPPRPFPGGRPLPQPVFGGSAGAPRSPGGYPGPIGAPVPRPGFPAGARSAPVRGARPSSPSAPIQVAAHPRGGYPRPATPPAGGIPAPVGPPFALPPSRPRNAGLDLPWLLGWLGFAVVVGLLVILVVWGFVTAQDKFRQDNLSRQAAALSAAVQQDYQAGRYEKALARYREMERLFPPHQRAAARSMAAQAAIALAEKHLKERRMDRAMDLGQQALELDPQLPDARILLGRVRAAQHQTDEAVAEFDLAIEAAERAAAAGSPEARQKAETARGYKAHTLLVEGQHLVKTDAAEARRRFAQAAEAAPGTPYAASARQEIAQLEASMAPRVEDAPVLPPPPPGMFPGWDFSYRKLALPQGNP